MRKMFLIMALIFCGLWSAPRATASSLCADVSLDIVSNCGFETGDFAGWTISGNTTNPGGNYYGVDGFDANSGNYGAFMSQDFFMGTSPVDLSQTLATSAGQTYDITFWLEQDTAPTTGYTHAFTATWGGTTLLTLTPTIALPGPVGVFTEYQFTETATGASTVLNFAFENDDSYWSFDDASVAPEVPEPSSPLLAGTALLAVALLRRMTAG